MGISSFNPLRFLTNLTTQVQLNNNYSVPFGNDLNQDSFQNNSVERLYNEKTIQSMISQNLELRKILDEHNLPARLNMNELLNLKNGHCRESANLCGEIYKVLPSSLKNSVNLKDLKDAAMLHDFGKVLVPAEILNKHGKLTDEEFRIMHLHSELGYQLLKNANLNNEVLSLIRYHHDNFQNNNFVPDINLQILNIADKYSALTENRVYKQALTPKQALTIIYSEVKKGNVHPFLYKALVQAVKNTETQTVAKV